MRDGNKGGPVISRRMPNRACHDLSRQGEEEVYAQTGDAKEKDGQGQEPHFERWQQQEEA